MQEAIKVLLDETAVQVKVQQELDPLETNSLLSESGMGLKITFHSIVWTALALWITYCYLKLRFELWKKARAIGALEKENARLTSQIEALKQKLVKPRMVDAWAQEKMGGAWSLDRLRGIVPHRNR